METLENVCALADKCKKAGTHDCNITCYPYVTTHGVKGDGGFMGTANIPKKFKSSYFSNLPIKQDNPQAYKVAEAYINDVLSFVSRGVGLFLYSVPNVENKRGTGTGKTTVATAIGNEYMKARIIQHVSGKGKLEEQPTLFMRVSEFQNKYNKQFRGTPDEQQEASSRVSKMIKQMERAELLILDDISLRSVTEALGNIIYEIIDERYINEKPVIFTSNYPIEMLGDTLSPQIQSRIEGMTEGIAFKGSDKRKGGIL